MKFLRDSNKRNCMEQIINGEHKMYAMRKDYFIRLIFDITPFFHPHFESVSQKYIRLIPNMLY